MPDPINFVDIVALTKIKSDTVVEKFGGMINSSFFDASNILGTMKLKGLIDFTTSFPGTSAIAVTELGKKVLGDADAASGNEFNQLDLTILVQLSQGKRTITDIGGAVNVMPNDLAMHLYKLGKQGYLSYDFRNGTITLALSEKGFMQAKTGMPMPQQPAATIPPMPGVQPQATAKTMTAAAQGMGAQQPMQQMAKPGATVDGPAIDINQLEANIKKARRRRLIGIVAVAVIIIALVALLALHVI